MKTLSRKGKEALRLFNEDVISKKKLKISAADAALLRKSQFVPDAPVYEPQRVLVTIPTGDFTPETRTISPRNGSTGFSINEAHFKIGEENFTVRYRNGVTPDAEMDLQVVLYVANREYKCTNGTVIKKGTEKIFAVNI